MGEVGGVVRAILAAALCAFVALAHPMGAQEDVSGSADHPDLGRFDGAWITRYDARDFDEYWLATSPVTTRAHGEGLALEGAVTRIAYKQNPGPSVAEVARNFEMRLQERGYDIIYECRDKDCGGYNFRYYGTEILPAPSMTVDLDNFRYIAARKAGETMHHAAILVSINNGAVLTQIMAVEGGALENRMVDAREMQSALSEAGHIALYSILFDTDSATIKPESRPALDEIAKLLNDNPALSILVVGHTDNQGTLDYNMALSLRRSRAITAELTNHYGIAAPDGSMLKGSASSRPSPPTGARMSGRRTGASSWSNADGGVFMTMVKVGASSVLTLMAFIGNAFAAGPDCLVGKWGPVGNGAVEWMARNVPGMRIEVTQQSGSIHLKPDGRYEASGSFEAMGRRSGGGGGQTNGPLATAASGQWHVAGSRFTLLPDIDGVAGNVDLVTTDGGHVVAPVTAMRPGVMMEYDYECAGDELVTHQTFPGIADPMTQVYRRTASE